ncbi:repressor LexA [Candidatus Daviesbacteria bacterium]|nr:repressor LexA [Candidatus Daviesbacteria bacterium]
MRHPTPKQQAIIDFIKNYFRQKAISPTFREIADNFGVSVGTIQDQLNSLNRLGMLTWIPGKTRSIKLASEYRVHTTQPVPLLGVISAGEGITVFEESDPEIIDVPSTMLNARFGYYCLKVSGFSMNQDGILDGDIIVVKQQATAQDGDTVIAIINDGLEERATLKRFYHRGNQIELRPRNQEYQSRFLNPEEVTVRGKFCGLLRRSDV